nr:subtype B tannase [Lactiplantibacillus daowaiensis]
MTLKFDGTRFNLRTAQLGNQTISYQAAMDIPYVAHPVDPIQKLNVFVPAGYFAGATINGYQRDTAPILMPNTVGGYLPGPSDAPDKTAWPTNAKTIIAALARGYVVISTGLRGRTQTAAGQNIGKAPAFIVDMKAAVRYVKANANDIPGDVDCIITNGTSAGGATSALMGASGNAPYFESALKTLGAAEASDNIFAVSAYCPIHNLEHADMAYEWEFNGLNDWYRQKMAMIDGRMRFTPWQGTLTPTQQQLSTTLKADFMTYLNKLQLTDTQGQSLTLDAQGNGSFKDLIGKYLVASAQRALTAGVDIHKYAGFTVTDDRVTGLDLDAYLASITRMKATPAFDDLGLTSPETDLFGDATTAAKHFTAFAQAHTTTPATLAPADLIAAINPVTYLTAAAKQSTVAPHWRIRHGAADRDTAFAIPVILATLLQNRGYDVDFALPWDTPHSGDYDLGELFSWIDGLCQQ